jgi:multidrug efflux system membrane fusion protein
MDFVDNASSARPARSAGRALMDQRGWCVHPRMFGRVRVPGSPAYQALLLPDTAIGSETGAQIRAGR